MTTVPHTREESRARLEDIILGYQKTQALYAAAKLSLAEHLAPGPLEVGALAAATGAHRGGLYRLLRVLEYLGLVREPAPGTFELTDLGAHLRGDSSSGIRDEVLVNVELFWGAWGLLEHGVRTGESSVPLAHGAPFFEFLHRQPEQVGRFNRVMTSMVSQMAKAFVSAYDFGPFRTIVDIGGGRGTLLTTILEAHPRSRGILFDLPSTAEEARTSLRDSGLGGRCVCIGGNFFESVPSGDLLILSAVISDWSDEQSVQILRNCRRALAAEGRLLLIERLLAPDQPAPLSSFMDLHMLVIGGGTGRSEAEYRRLLTDAGLDLVRVVPTDSPRSIFEARPSTPGT